MLTQMLKRTVPMGINIEELAKTHYDAVWRFCYRRVGPNLASDAAQETFETAIKRASSFRNLSDPKTWLFGIAVNVCRNLLKKNPSSVSLSWIENLQSADPTNTSLLRHDLLTAIQKLSPEHREVIILHELEEFTYTEIAALLNIPDGTVKSRLFHAFQHLRRYLNAEEAAKS